MNKPVIFVLGADGYIGWPVAMSAAEHYRQHHIVLVDCGLRRKLVAEVGGHSLLPIASFPDRMESLKSLFDCSIETSEIDINSIELDKLFAAHKPEIVFHLAQQPSAGYSMRGVEEAVFTLQNNECNNMRVLWAMRRHCPNAHLVKMGSFGEYDKSGIDIAEGYFLPSYNGKTATRPTPFPRASSDIYHISKINDSNIVGMSCRNWGLRVTEVMQSVVVGVYTGPGNSIGNLSTRFDYDSCFGTVVNRFIVQGLAGHDITVYGTGNQRSGLMALDDCVRSLLSISEQGPERSEHRVINHLTETNFSINEIAVKVQSVLETFNISSNIVRNIVDPREESIDKKEQYSIETKHVSNTVAITPFEKVIGDTCGKLVEHRSDINADLLQPHPSWC